MFGHYIYMVEELRERHERGKRFMFAMQNMILMMQQVDDTCVQLTQTIDKRDLHTLAFIGDNTDVKMKDIAELLDVPMSTATGIVQKLVDKDLVERATSQHDRRAIILLLTSAGAEIHQLLHSMRVSMTKRIMDDLTEQEFDTLLDLLEKIHRNLKSYAADVA